MMEALPAAALIMPEANFLLEVVIVALDAPPQFGEIDEAAERHVGVNGCEPILVGLTSPLGHSMSSVSFAGPSTPEEATKYRYGANVVTRRTCRITALGPGP